MKHEQIKGAGSTRLTPETFDATFGSRDKIWGLGAIARSMGCSVDKVRRLARLEGSPIYHSPAGYLAFRSELNAWLRGKA
ncbi:DNA-binding protein [Frigidibacter oleivorans]|uniref:DNA-binding protein n=1 Tax=Frigidibacter oleivorans TaxID=2487129 RepID=UPI00197AB71B|nr:DNA-binding protein [Frigidibacter oleivorans]